MSSNARPLLIGITGGSGSGKTSFIHRLSADFPTDALCVISQDEYYLPEAEQQLDENGIHNFDLPTAIDELAFQKDLEALQSGQSIQREEYTFNNEKREPKIIDYHPAPIIIVEGLFVFHFKAIRALMDLKLFIHAKDSLKIIRRIKRDRVERNYPLEDVLYRYEHHVLPSFAQYVLPYKELADMIINNNDNFDGGYKVIKGFLRDYLVKAGKIKQEG